MSRRSVAVSLVALHVAALWPVALWYVERIADRGGSPWGLVPLAAALILVARTRRAEPVSLATASGLLAAYVVLWQVAPPLIAAAVAALSLASLLGALRLGRRLDPALAGLLLLSLPDISTLQVFVGWPFRTAVAAVVSTALSVVGVDAARQGTVLLVDGRAIAVDAACSGVWMGWGAVLAWLALALARRSTPRRTLAGLVVLAPVVFLANALRTSSLALASARVEVPGWAHEGIGIVAFAAVAAGVVLLSERLAPPGRGPCAAPSST